MRSARRNGGLPDGATRRFCVAALRPRGCAPCAAYAAYPAHPPNRYTRLRGYIGSAGLKTKIDTLTAHRERPGGRSFFYPFSAKGGQRYEQRVRRASAGVRGRVKIFSHFSLQALA